jgi:hypothetical protein
MPFFSSLLLPFRPRLLIPRLLEDRRKLALAVYGLLLIGGLYTIAVYIGFHHGFGAVMTPFLRIPAEQYYLWETFFCIPAYFLVAIIFAGVARLVAAGFHGQGSFENAFVLYSLSLVLPMLITMWLPESLVMIVFPSHRSTALGGFRLWPTWVDALRQLAGVFWPLGITVYGIHISEKTRVAQSILVGLIAFIPASAMILLLIR